MDSGILSDDTEIGGHDMTVGDVQLASVTGAHGGAVDIEAAAVQVHEAVPFADDGCAAACGGCCSTRTAAGRSHRNDADAGSGYIQSAARTRDGVLGAGGRRR